MIKKERLLCFVLLVGMSVSFPVMSAEKFVAVLDFTPVLNTPDIRHVFGGSDGRTLAVDDDGAIRALEFIALPGTVFTVEDEIVSRGQQMYRVRTSEYPYPSVTGYFIPASAVRDLPPESSARSPRILSADEILERMLSWVGLPYVWGGNAPEGVADVLDYFLPRLNDSQNLLDQWMLKGLDCSGLLYAATDGVTPRNTSALVSYGEPVAVEGLSTQEISTIVKPLDLIVWKGHVVIVLDGRTVIESRMDHEPQTPGQQGGVWVRLFQERIDEIRDERIAVNDLSACPLDEECFVIRRWYKEGREREDI